MIVVGELINAGRKAISEAIRCKDSQAIQALSRQQHEAGAGCTDVNAGPITPIPGGVALITIATRMMNRVNAAKPAAGISSYGG